MKVLVIGTDRTIFEDNSLARSRVLDQGTVIGELHVVVFAKKTLGLRKERMAPNIWIYPTNSRTRFHYILDAVVIGKKICRDKFFVKGNDVISTQDPFECGLAGLLISRATSLPFQAQIHTDFLSPFFKKFSPVNRLRVLIAKHILPKASGVRTVSQRIADSIGKCGIKLRRKVDTLPVFLDVNRLEPRGESFDLRRRYPQFDYLMLGVGRLQPEKNFTQAIRILAGILPKRPHAGLFIVGEGPEKSKLLALALRLGVKDKVIFLPYDKNLYYYYKSADVFLFTSFYEGYGLVLLEAALLGCPIVTADVGMSRELISEEFRSFVCPVGDTKCFLRRISELADNHGVRENYSTALFNTARKLVIFDKQSYIGRYARLMSDTSKNI